MNAKKIFKGKHVVILLCYTLFLISYALYVLGLLEPVFTFEPKFSFGNAIIHAETRPLPATVHDLLLTKSYYPAMLIIGFSFVLPILKFVIGTIEVLKIPLMHYINKRRKRRFEEHSISEGTELLSGSKAFFPHEKFLVLLCFKFNCTSILRAISKFQFTDTFMAVILSAHMNDALLSVVMREGAYYFCGYCVLTLLATQLFAASVKKPTLDKLYNGPISPELQLPTNTDKGEDQEEAFEEDDFLDNGEVGAYQNASIGHVRNAIAGVRNGKIMKFSKETKKQLLFTVVYLIFLVIVVIASCACYLFVPVANFGVSFLGQLVDLSRSDLSGSSEIQRLYYTSSHLNGCLVLVTFSIVAPTITAISTLIMTAITPFLKPFNGKRGKTFVYDASAVNDVVQLYLRERGFPYTSYKHLLLSDMDAKMLHFIHENRAMILALKVLYYMVDWCMAEVLSLGMLSSYFTMNAEVVMTGSVPISPYPFSSFWLLYLFGISSLILTHNIRFVAKTMINLEKKELKIQKAISYYERRLELANEMLLVTQADGWDKQRLHSSNDMNSTVGGKPETNSNNSSEICKPSDYDIISKFFKATLVCFTATLAASILFVSLSFVFTHEKKDFSIKSIDAHTRNFMAPLTGILLRGRRDVVGNCSYFPHHPCFEEDSADLYVNEIMGIKFEFAALQGIRSFKLRNGFTNQTADNRIHFGFGVEFDVFVPYIILSNCTVPPCVVIYEGTDLCCGDKPHADISLSLSCNSSYDQLLYDFRVDDVTTSPLLIDFGGVTVDLGSLIKSQLPPILTAEMNNEAFIEWRSEWVTLPQLFNLLTHQNQQESELTCPVYEPIGYENFSQHLVG